MKRFIIILFLASLSIHVFGQDTATAEPPSKYDIARKQIIQLKDGVLLAKLQSKRKQIEHYRKRGLIEKANELSEETYKRNLEITYSLKEKLKFCKIYFFYDYNTPKIKQNQYDSVILDFELTPTLEFVNSNYQKENVFIMNTSFIESKSMNSTITGFAIADCWFNQLRAPFPYYVRQWRGTPLKKDYDEMAEVLNRKLNKYYNKAISKSN